MGGWEKNKKSFRENIFFVEQGVHKKLQVQSRHEFTHRDVLDFYQADSKRKKSIIKRINQLIKWK